MYDDKTPGCILVPPFATSLLQLYPKLYKEHKVCRGFSMRTLIETALLSTDLGPNNPSKQCDGANGCNYHYARGDGGWISAFEVCVT